LNHQTSEYRQLASSVLLPGFRGTTLPEWLRERLAAGLAGVCLFAENIAATPAESRDGADRDTADRATAGGEAANRDGADRDSDGRLAALTEQIRAANPTAVVAIDEEGGDVTRLAAATGSPYPGNAVLGRLDDPALTAAVARAVATRLAAGGVSLNFAPVADVNSNPLNPVIGVRSFGASAELVARHVAAWTAAHEEVGVATSVKHFPGHGDVALDSHHDLPVLDIDLDLLRSRELGPFAAAIAAGARTVMTSHIVVRAVDPTGPATFSAPVLQGLLRDDLGFAGVIVSDALDMRGASGSIGIPAAAVRALAAGVDLLCLGTRITDEQLTAIESAIVAAVESGELPADRLREAAARVAGLAATPPPAVPSGDPSETTGLPDADRIGAAFDVRPGAVPPAGARIVQIETAANMAVGRIPWGLAAAGVAVETLLSGDPVPAGPLVLIGKDNHRHPWVCELIDKARAAGPTLVVDMGWPSPDRAYADVATFGASRAVGIALHQWLIAHGLGQAR
jgi:beta-N-acetylhexosaminidase